LQRKRRAITRSSTIRDEGKQIVLAALISGLGTFGNRSASWIRTVNRSDTGSCRRALEMHRARAAQRHTACELGASHLEHVAKHPQQRGVPVSVHRMRLAVYRENICHSAPVILSRVTVRRRKRPNLGVHRPLRNNLRSCSMGSRSTRWLAPSARVRRAQLGTRRPGDFRYFVVIASAAQ
jgi:hypothetical protein